MDRKLSDNPIIIILGIVSSLLAIFVFVTGYDNLSLLLGQKREIFPSSQPTQDESNDILLAPEQTTVPVQSLRSKISFMSDRDDEMAIYIMELDGTGISKLIKSPKIINSGFAWSLDGQKFAFGKYRTDTQFVTGEIWTTNVDGSNLSQLTNTQEFLNESPSWSPDGLKIVFSSAYNGIYIVDTTDNKLINLTKTKGDEVDGSPSWSPDGQHIAFVSNRNNPNSRYDIYTMSIDGSYINL